MKKIKETKVINLTEFSYTEQVDEELMYQTFLNYKINGGDLDHLIYFNPNDKLLNLFKHNTITIDTMICLTRVSIEQ